LFLRNVLMDPREQAVLGVCRDIIRTASALRKELDRVFSDAGLSGPQFGILSQLETLGSMPLGELGKRLWVSCGNVTGLVDKLVAAGYVRRVRLRKDRRVVRAELTDKGTELIRELIPRHRECVLRFTAGLADSELQNLKTLLEKTNGAPEEASGCSMNSGGSK
jgi:MarR family transcriptional regulator, 2-MHQ and catechol-resistance regulon repressor